MARTVKWWWLLAVLTVLRLAIAANVQLAPDEAYYWVWSHALAPGYPDHPPMVALWIRLSTLIVGDTPFGIRLLGPLSIAIASLLLADTADALFPAQRAGIRIAILLNATLLLGVGAIIMTPDTPLLVFWAACLWAIAKLLQSGNPAWWIAIGLFAGLAMVSKYTAALLWFGIVLWVLATPSTRTWLFRPMPWLGAALGFLVFLPVVWWNANHDWVSFVRQGGRLGDWRPGNALRFMTEFVAGQFGLLTPLVFVFCIGGIAVSARAATRERDPAPTLLAALTLPPILLFAQHALGDRVQGNWPAIIYPAAALGTIRLQAPAWRRLWTPAVILGFAITLLVYAQASFNLLPLPIHLDPIALVLSGWDKFAAQISTVRQQAQATYIASDEYGVAAQLAHALPTPVIGLDPRWTLIDLPHAAIAGQVGILVHSGTGEPNRTPWSTMTGLGELTRGLQKFRVYRVTAVTNPVDARLLSRH